ncbi:hypothetical protein C8Q70DRAFT_406680 [Cubamyces menziesii]|nr:hypothetical protein C8Q70DRAFT_406680 [Cubamyces menziesii]
MCSGRYATCISSRSVSAGNPLLVLRLSLALGLVVVSYYFSRLGCHESIYPTALSRYRPLATPSRSAVIPYSYLAIVPACVAARFKLLLYPRAQRSTPLFVYQALCYTFSWHSIAPLHRANRRLSCIMSTRDIDMNFLNTAASAEIVSSG